MSSIYRAPGVYITQVQNPAFGALPAGFRIPGVVGTGKSTLPVSNTPITKGALNGADTIPTSGQQTVISISSVGDVPSLTQYIQGVDWRQVGNTIQWISGGSQPTTGAIYYVSWCRAKVAAEYVPMLFTAMKDIRDFYGNELENGVYNCISTACVMLFQNGAPAVIISQALTAAVTDIENAIDAMKNEDIDFLLVPQATNTTLQAYVRGHVLTESSPTIRHERIQITSADGFSDATTTIVAKAIAQDSNRIWVMAPPSVNVTLHDAITQNDQQLLLPSSLALAAAYMGVATNPNFDAAEPLTRKTIVGIDNLSTFNYQEVDMNFLGANGVTVVDDSPNLNIRHALTTDTTNVNTVTASITVITDFIKKTLRPLLDKAYIGTKITAQTPAQVGNTITTFLEQQITNQIIVAYQNVIVTQDATDPRTIDVQFDIKPVYPLEFIDVSFSLVTA